MSNNPEKRAGETKKANEDNIKNEANESNQRQQQEPQPPMRKQDPRQPVEVNADADNDASSTQVAAQGGSSATTGAEGAGTTAI
jgi:hypothetical protein